MVCFYVEPLPDSKEPSKKKKRWTFIKKQDKSAILCCQYNNEFLMILCSIDDITSYSYTEKADKFGNIMS